MIRVIKASGAKRIRSHNANHSCASLLVEIKPDERLLTVIKFYLNHEWREGRNRRALRKSVSTIFAIVCDNLYEKQNDLKGQKQQIERALER